MSLEVLTAVLVIYFIGFALLTRLVRDYRAKKRLYIAHTRRKKAFSGQGYDLFEDVDPLTELKFGDLSKQPGTAPFVTIHKTFHPDPGDV